MAWIPLPKRPELFRQGLATYALNASPPSTAEAVYDQHELGLLSDADIQAWLDQKTKTTQPEVGVTDEAPLLSSPFLREEDAYSTKTLRWLIQNASTVDDKTLAKQRYRELLFELWRKYVAETGQPWFPPLRNDLWDRYKIFANDPDSI